MPKSSSTNQLIPKIFPQNSKKKKKNVEFFFHKKKKTRKDKFNGEAYHRNDKSNERKPQSATSTYYS